MEEVTEAGTAALAAARKELEDKLNQEIGEVGVEPGVLRSRAVLNFSTDAPGAARCQFALRCGRPLLLIEPQLYCYWYINEHSAKTRTQDFLDCVFGGIMDC
jgi:hypothetical protein